MTTSVTFPSKTTGANPLKGLLEYGQSPWMDYIRRDLLTGDGLKQMINDDGLRGMTSNPAIFEKSIVGSKLYSDILTSAEAKTLDAKGLYEKIAIRDVRDACDIFKPVYQQTHRRDGYVSLEVSPYLANDTKGTLEEARRLWKTVGRENLAVAGRRTQHQHNASFRTVGVRKGRRGIPCSVGGASPQGVGH